MTTHAGGCHCGAVRFEIDAPADIEAARCNCSICAMSGGLHLIVPQARFRLLSDPAELTEYRFNTGVAVHRFCRTCGIKSFYVPRSNPDGVSVNPACLDPGTIASMNVVDFDGQNWEDNAADLAHLSATPAADAAP